MTPSARVQTAIEILEKIETVSRPADQVVAGELRARRYVGSKDRRAIQALVYGVLRHRARLDWWLERTDLLAEALPAERPRLRMVAWTATREPEAEDGLGALFDGRGYGAAPLRSHEEGLARALAGRAITDAEQPAAVRTELPEWLHALLCESLGEHADSELAALGGEAPLDLRVNTLKAERDAARAALAEEGIDTQACALSPVGLRATGRLALPATRAFRDGLIEVQDEASQLAALLVNAGPDMAVADLCAGGGGKALALAATMDNRGRLDAMDNVRARLERAAPRLSRAGITCCHLQVLTGAEDPWLTAGARQFDRVLVDAPCSGSGAWRRNPDARWRLTPEILAELQATQADLLDTAAALVRPGGRLVYATCSLLSGENAEQVDAFLGRAGDFSCVPYGEVWERTVASRPPDEEAMLTLTPARNGTDGFFVAILERSA